MGYFVPTMETQRDWENRAEREEFNPDLLIEKEADAEGKPITRRTRKR